MKDALYFIHKRDGFYVIKKEEGGCALGRDSNGSKVKIPTDKISAWIGAGEAYVSMSQIRDDSEFG